MSALKNTGERAASSGSHFLIPHRAQEGVLLVVQRRHGDSNVGRCRRERRFTDCSVCPNFAANSTSRMVPNKASSWRPWPWISPGVEGWNSELRALVADTRHSPI
jgi:hypothetical protein